MSSTVRAIEVNVQIMRTFVRLREMLSAHKDLARRLDELEKKYAEHSEQFVAVFQAIRQSPGQNPAPEIGYHTLIERK